MIKSVEATISKLENPSTLEIAVHSAKVRCQQIWYLVKPSFLVPIALLSLLKGAAAVCLGSLTRL